MSILYSPHCTNAIGVEFVVHDFQKSSSPFLINRKRKSRIGEHLKSMRGVKKCLIVWSCLRSDFGGVVCFKTLKIIISACCFNLGRINYVSSWTWSLWFSPKCGVPLTNCECNSAGIWCLLSPRVMMYKPELL